MVVAHWLTICQLLEQSVFPNISDISNIYFILKHFFLWMCMHTDKILRNLKANCRYHYSYLFTVYFFRRTFITITTVQKESRTFNSDTLIFSVIDFAVILIFLIQKNVLHIVVLCMFSFTYSRTVMNCCFENNRTMPL